MNKIYAIILLLAVAGCQKIAENIAGNIRYELTGEIPETKTAEFQKQCTAFGFKKDSDKYAECVMEMSNQWREDMRVDNIRSAMSAPDYSKPRMMNCTSTKAGSMVHTNCNNW